MWSYGYRKCNWWCARRDWILRTICSLMGIRWHQGGWKIFWHQPPPHESFIGYVLGALYKVLDPINTALRLFTQLKATVTQELLQNTTSSSTQLMATYSTHTLYTRNKKEMQRPRTVMKNRDFVLWKTAIIWRSVPTSLDVLAVAALLTACSVLQQLAAHLYLLSLLQLMHSTDLACTDWTALHCIGVHCRLYYNALNCSSAALFLHIW